MHYLKQAFILVKSLIIKILGVVLIVVGIAGLFLPIIPGTVFIVMGIALVSGKALVYGAKHVAHKVKHASKRVGKRVKAYLEKKRHK